MHMHCPKMISTTVCLAVIAMFFSPCIAFQYNIPKPFFPVPSNHHGQGHAFPPLPPYHVRSPPHPAAPTHSPVWSIPLPARTSQSPPHMWNQPGFPHPFQRHPMIPIPGHRLSPPPPSVSGFPQPPTPNPTNPTPIPTPPSDGYAYLTAPAQPPISSVPHSQVPPSPPHNQFPPSPPHSQFPPSPPHSQFPPSPPHHQFAPFPPHRQFSPFPPRRQIPPFPPRHGMVMTPPPN